VPPRGFTWINRGDYHVAFTYRLHGWRLACTLFWTALGLYAALTFATLLGANRRRRGAWGTEVE